MNFYQHWNTFSILSFYCIFVFDTILILTIYEWAYVGSTKSTDFGIVLVFGVQIHLACQNLLNEEHLILLNAKFEL